MDQGGTCKDRVVLAVLCLLAVVLHLPVLGLSFFSDDFSILHRIGVTGDAGTGSFFRPLPDWTLYVNHIVTGPRPWTFRLENVLLLGINGWLVYLLARRMLRTMGIVTGNAPVFAGLLFVLYPFHNEPQLWIVGRSTAMATGFILTGIIIALGQGPTARRVIGVFLSGVLGALCYESALLLPGLLLACMLITPVNERRTWILLLGTSTIVVVLNLLTRMVWTGHVANAYGGAFFDATLPDLFMRGVKAVARLLLPPLDDEQAQLIRGGIVGTGLLVAGVLFWWRAPHQRMVVIALVLMVVVSSAIGTVASVSTRTSESDRFLYLPSAFVCLLAVLMIGTLLRGRGQVAAMAMIGALSVVAMQRNHAHWKVASHTIGAIVQATPQAPAGTRIHIHGLPSDHKGAFIFRHGFHEALLYAGKDTSGLVRTDTLLWGLAADGQLPALSFEDRDDTLIIRPNDLIMTWNGNSFVPVALVVR